MTLSGALAKRTVLAALAVVALVGLLQWTPRVTAQARAVVTRVDCPLHNLDLAGSRYSTMDAINRSNVKALAPRWLFQHGVIDGVSSQTTPVIVDGRMYVTDSRGSVYAVDAADGHLLWSYDVTEKLGGGANEDSDSGAPPILFDMQVNGRPDR